MSYGIAVQTQSGLQDISATRSAQAVFTVRVYPTANGSVASPSGITAANSFAYAVANDGKTAPALELRENGRAYWLGDYITRNTNTNDMTIIFARMR